MKSSSCFLGGICVAPLINNWTIHEMSQCVEIMLAVTRAHEDTLRCEESLLEDAPECIQEVCKRVSVCERVSKRVCERESVRERVHTRGP